MLADSHALVWWLSPSPLLSKRARCRLDLGIPVEEWLRDLRTLPYVRIEPVIVATARILGLKLVTSDERLRRSQEVETVW